jgi:hypothetical protein
LKRVVEARDGRLVGEVQRRFCVSKESRKKLASLGFSEKVKLLEKLRERSLALSEARKKLKETGEKTDH